MLDALDQTILLQKNNFNYYSLYKITRIYLIVFLFLFYIDDKIIKKKKGGDLCLI